MKHLNVSMQVSDLAAKLYNTLVEAAETNPHEDVAKAAAEAVVCWLSAYAVQAKDPATLTAAFSTQMLETAPLVQRAILESYIASIGGRN
jgi:hypothetical protein